MQQPVSNQLLKVFGRNDFETQVVFSKGLITLLFEALVSFPYLNLFHHCCISSRFHFYCYCILLTASRILNLVFKTGIVPKVCCPSNIVSFYFSKNFGMFIRNKYYEDEDQKDLISFKFT